MTERDPLSPASLMVPEVRKARDEVEENIRDRAREVEDDTKICRDGKWDYPTTRADIDKSFDALLLAVREATLKAERSRLLALTPEATIEAAAKAMCEADSKFFDPAARLPWEMATPDTQAQYRAMAEDALPVLVAPERAKREQVEREFREELEEHADTIRDEEKATERYIAAEAEAGRLREALEAVEWKGAVNGDPACPMCGQWAEPLGDSEHDPDCQLRAALEAK